MKSLICYLSVAALSFCFYGCTKDDEKAATTTSSTTTSGSTTTMPCPCDYRVKLAGTYTCAGTYRYQSSIEDTIVNITIDIAPDTDSSMKWSGPGFTIAGKVLANGKFGEDSSYWYGRFFANDSITIHEEYVRDIEIEWNLKGKKQ